MAPETESQEMEASEVYRLLEGRVTFGKEENGHKIYYVVPKEDQKVEELFQVFHIGQHHSADPPTSTRCVLLLGGTGAGKTTFVNAALNYLFGVKFDDPFRLQVKEAEDGRRETDSHTDIITIYKVYYQEGMKHKYNFVIIDTPGSDDTRGQQQQQVIMHNLEALFTTDFGVDDLHCLGIVAKGSDNRCVDHQRNLLQEIVSLLGKYVPDITHVFATHALEEVKVDGVMRDSGISFKSMFEFDNGCLFDPKETGKAYDPRKRWKIMTQQYDAFFDTLITASPVSTEILREKKLYDTCKKNLREQIELLADSMVATYHAKEEYDKYEALKEENKNWKEAEVVEVPVEERLENGNHAHNCTICKQTCRTCTSVSCFFVPPSPSDEDIFAAGGGTPLLWGLAAGGVVADLVVGRMFVPAFGVLGLGIGHCSIKIIKGISKFRGIFVCGESDCGHPNSKHLIEQIEKSKQQQENEIIHEEMKRKFEEAFSNKSYANTKLTEGNQKVLSRRNRLSKDAVELLRHAKRIHELTSQDFAYMEDIIRYLDGIQLKDKICIPAHRRVVQDLKGAMQQLSSCTTDQVRGKQRFVEEMLPGDTETLDMMTGQLPAASE